MSSRYTITIEKPFTAAGPERQTGTYFNLLLTMLCTKEAEIAEIPGCW